MPRTPRRRQSNLRQDDERTFQTAQTCGPQAVTMPTCHLRDAMPKSDVSRGAPRKRRPAGRAELSDGLAGQIEEICRDLSLQVKRMKQLQEQAEELRTALRGWAGSSERLLT